MATPERRMTVFPGSSTARVPHKRQNTGEEEMSSQRLSASKIPKIPDSLVGKQRSQPPAPLPVKVKPDSARYRHQSGPFPTLEHSNVVFRKGSPWNYCRAILVEVHDGSVTLAHSKDRRHEIYAIRQQKCADTSSLERLTRFQHDNLVTLHMTYLDDDCLYFLYEPMDVSLAEIQSTPLGALGSSHLAAVCIEVLRGIQFIHETLKIIHNEISADSVLLDRSGQIKIAYIGSAVMRGVPAVGKEQTDIRALARLMIRLMEPGTNLIDPDSRELRDPDRWDEATKRFLERTEHSSSDELLKDDFLKESQGTAPFKELVRVTERSIPREWRLLIR